MVDRILFAQKRVVKLLLFRDRRAVSFHDGRHPSPVGGTSQIQWARNLLARDPNARIARIITLLSDSNRQHRADNDPRDYVRDHVFGRHLQVLFTNRHAPIP